MKNKTKKILAGACLGLVGMGALTGCAMSDEQKTALDKVVGKADEIISLIEKQNKELTFLEAVRLYEFAKTKLLVNYNNCWNNLRIKIHEETTEDMLECGNVMDCEYHLFKNAEGKRVAYYSYSTTSDKNPQINHSETSGYVDDSESSSEYLKKVYECVSDMLDFNEVTEENIVNLETKENGNYLISVVAEIELYSDFMYNGKLSSSLNVPTLIYIEITPNGQLVSKRYTSIIDEHVAGEFKEHQEFDIILSYEYETLTENEVQENIANINS